MAEYSKIELELGETWTIKGVLNTDNTPLDLTNSVIKWKVASQKGVILQIDNSNGGAITTPSPTAGSYQIIIPPSLQANTTGLIPGIYRHELSVVLPDNTVSIQYEGPLEIKSSITSLYG